MANIHSTPTPLEFNLTKASALIGIHPNTLRRWITLGKVQASKAINGQTLVPASEVQRLLTEGAKQG